MEATCRSCGRALEACYCPPPGEGHSYSPPILWHALGFPAWVVTVLPNLQATHSQAELVGQVIGLLIVPVVVRIVYVMALAGPPRVWERALFSPWVWCIGLALNVMAASGHHPH